MSNHFHVILEVLPMPEFGISDVELLQRLVTLYLDAFVSEGAKQLAAAGVKEWDEWASETDARFSHRMDDSSEFMKTLRQRFSRGHERTGTLWKER